MLHRTRTRAVAAVATIALLGGAGFLALTPAAQAANPAVQLIGSLASTTGPTTVFAGLGNQPGGTWTTNPIVQAVGASTNTESWTMFIMLDDVIPAVPAGPLGPLTPGTPAKCKAASLAVGFTGTPVVTNTTAGNTAKFAARYRSSSVCTGINDILEIDSTQQGAAGAVLTISGVAYNVGASVPSGAIRYKVNDLDEDGLGYTTAVSNAVVTDVGAASKNAAILVAPKPAGKPAVSHDIADLVIKEQRAGAIKATGVCVSMDSPPAGTTFTTAAPKPGVIATGGAGKGTPGAITFDGTGTKFSFPVTVSTNPAPVPTTYTVTGLALTTGTDLGPVDVDVTAGPCGTGALFDPGVRLATVGGVGRVAGANRYGTAGAVADANPDFADLAGRTVVIARGDNFPDALAASYLAGQNDVPILLTTPTSVPAETVATLRTHGVTDVILVGGTTSITPAVQTFLAALPTYPADIDGTHPDANSTKLTVTRVGGGDRYETADLVAKQPGLDQAGTVGIKNGTTCDAQKTAIMASGENFPDALAAGGLAFAGVKGCGAGPLPLLLTQKNGLTLDTVNTITALGIKQIILMGGEATVVPAVQTALDSLPGVSVTRVAGPTRQDTAVALANSVLGPDTIGKWDGGGFLVARPDTFPDALTASSLSGSLLSPLYLAATSSDLGATNTKAVSDYPYFYGVGGAVGGTTSLTDAVLTAMATAIASQPS